MAKELPATDWFRNMVLRALLFLGLLGGSFTPAMATPDWSVATNVTVIETTYVPDHIGFQISTAAGTCAAGQWITWYPQGADQTSKIANVQAVLATLMTAKAGNKRIMLFGANTNCAAQFIWLID